MSELNNAASKWPLRHGLMATASAATLVGLMLTSAARASSADNHPTVWIEVGGQLDHLNSEREPYAPAFTVLGEQHGLKPLQDLTGTPKLSVGENASISFQPAASDWTISASIQYGRSNKSEHRHEQTVVKFVGPFFTQQVLGPGGYVSRTSDYTVKSSESHTVVDFKVGKDVGLGLLKDRISSQIELGVRFAQFSSHTKMDLHAIPNPHLANMKYITPFYASIYVDHYYQMDKAKPEITRNFHGWGPTLSWSGALPVLGSEDETEISFDFGANVGVLFGRQKVQTQHHTSSNSYVRHALGVVTGQPTYVRYRHDVNSDVTSRSRGVVVPNVGGMAGISLKFPNAKVTFGYRADFFFSVIDGGVDTRVAQDRGFRGPFATISVGLGG